MNAAAQLPFGTDEALERFAHLWTEAAKASLPDQPSTTTLLRLAVLRDVYRTLHSEKSRFLAGGMKDEARALKQWEARLEELRMAELGAAGAADAGAAGEDLFAALSGKHPLKKRTRVIPQGLFRAVEKEKLERYDRVWENALAAEASSVGWRFWRLEAWVKISAIEEWNRRLTEQLWPDGIVLFVESAGFEESTRNDPEAARWQGHWTVMLTPRFSNAQEIALDLGNWPGSCGAVHWKAVYTPPAPIHKILRRS